MGKIRPNRAKEKLAAGGIVVSLGGLASSDLIDQIGRMTGETATYGNVILRKGVTSG